MKSILVPTDFSECAGAATKAAIKLAQKTGASIDFLHLLSVPADWIPLIDYEDKLYADAQQKVRKANHALNALVEQAEKAGTVAKRFICYDENHTEILHHQEKHGNDFIIMGSHGASGFKEFFIGSMSQKIARQAPVPVLVVKNPTAEYNFDNVVFTSDFQKEAIPQFQEVVDFCRSINAQLHLVYINSPMYFTDSDTIDKRLATFTSICPELVASVSTFNYQSLEGGLVRFCEHINPDMIALIIHSRKPLYNNLIDYALTYAGKPVLCISREVVKARQVLAY